MWAKVSAGKSDGVDTSMPNIVLDVTAQPTVIIRRLSSMLQNHQVNMKEDMTTLIKASTQSLQVPMEEKKNFWIYS